MDLHPAGKENQNLGTVPNSQIPVKDRRIWGLSQEFPNSGTVPKFSLVKEPASPGSLDSAVVDGDPSR